MKLGMLGLVILAAAAAQTLPGCKDSCGNVSIPYPFGLNPGCCLGEDFLITCNNTAFDPPQAFLTTFDIPVLNISLDEGLLLITSHKTYRIYSSGNTTSYHRETLILEKFSISDTKNKFTVVGCDTLGVIVGFWGQSYTTGCVTKCESINDVKNGSCSGIGCCQTTIPKYAMDYGITLVSYEYDNHDSVFEVNNCSYGFVVGDGFYNFSSSHLYNLTTSSFPMFLDWSIGYETCHEAKKNQTSYACKENSNCSDSQNGPGYLCHCLEGFNGNPYLQNGCVDINECETGSHHCSHFTCHNYPGGYGCSCPPGYIGDGWNNGTNCRVNRNSKRFPVIVVVLGISISLLVSLLLVSWLHIGLRQRKLNKLREKFFVQNGGSLLRREHSRRKLSKETTQIFTEEDLKKATNNYHESRILGRGGQGIVYKGILPDERVVAIKKSSRIGDERQVEEFINEVIVVSQINHQNVVKLLGCCLETQVPLLVYEFVTNGTLFHHIHNVEDNNNSPLLPWETRFKIASETAGALSYLHSAASIPIIHRDIKSANILLEDDYTAKVADFGASRLVPNDQTELVTLMQGTLGYVDPEYLQTSQFSDKSDVYSFGVVLVELLTGKKAFSFRNPEDLRNLAIYFVSAIKEDRLLEVLDHRVVNASNVEQVKEVAMLARRCVRVKGEERPSMKEVAYKLEGLRVKGDHDHRPWVACDLYPEETERFIKPANGGDHGDAGSASTSRTTGYSVMSSMEIKAGKYNQTVMMKLSMLGLTILAAAAVVCQESCGNVSIPYPFGLTQDCYLDDRFLITCNTTTSDPPQAFLSTSNIPIPKTSSLSSDATQLVSSVVPGVGNVQRGGSHTIPITWGQKYTTACVSLCDSITDVVNGSCSGDGCCQTIIPKNAKSYEIYLDNYFGDDDVSVFGFKNRSYGFVVGDGFYTFSSSHLYNLTITSFPMFLDWSNGDQTCNEAKKNQSSYACKQNSNCSNSQNGPGYLCHCLEGFNGNPSLQNGCMDINECGTGSHHCNSSCHNYPGGYNCSCPPGYIGDGWNNGTSCMVNRNSKRFLVIVVVLGISTSLLVLLLLVSWLHIGLRRRNLNELRDQFFERNGGNMLRRELSRLQLSKETTQIFTEEDLKKATGNYHESRILGRGRQGIVYKGMLPDQRVAAVKESSRIGDERKVEEFINEVIVFSQINHRNVVKLLGCCLETQVPLLVYEFVTNGTLFHHIHNVEGNNNASQIPRETRFKIASETAGALSYLHSAASIPIIHRDVKSANILLDHDYIAKVANFGASRLIPRDQTELVTLVKGTLGYMDPEYMHTSQLTEKSDVYSFGVVLIELLTGKKAFCIQNPEDKRHLAIHFVSAIKEDRLLEILDHRVVNASNIEKVKEVAMLAGSCVRVKGEERPSMIEVAYKLEGLRAKGDHVY
ncbi:wall-associated receptor kinase 3-like [Tripterygium wilfordii]|uniref:wall-associated receptor kinase 3-like n=1 Tax=Tripterygium wilfordii TaxID=458696 RepID=UPI0018F82C57|nr:wall-associated receptor kinase 3-like [Tripterygium wilfordii]